MHCKKQRRIISEIYMFIFQRKFGNTPHSTVSQKKVGLPKIQWDFQISKVGSLDFLDLKVNGSPGRKGLNILTTGKLQVKWRQIKEKCSTWLLNKCIMVLEG